MTDTNTQAIATIAITSDLGYTAQSLDTIGKQVVPEGMRLARIIRKTSSKDSNGMESQGIHVPAPISMQDAMSNATLQEYMQQCLQGVQDKIIRKVTDNGRNIITDGDISLDAMAEYLEATDDNIGRISKDRIAGWFASELQDTLMVAFAEKLGIGSEPTPDQVTKLAQTVARYKDCFGTLAGKNPTVAPAVGENLLKALDMIPADAFTLRLQGIVTKAMQVVEPDMLGL